MRDILVTGAGRVRVGAGGVAGAAVTAALAALTDAGMPRTEVTGLLAIGCDAVDVADALGLELLWRAQENDTSVVGAGLVQAVDAVAAGRTGTVVCVEALAPDPARARAVDRFGPAAAVAGRAGWHAPYGADGALVGVALAARAYIERYGLTRTELAQVAMVASANVGGGLRLRDYLAAPMLVDPLCLHDRARPAGGAAAIVLSTRTRDASPRIRVDGVGAAYAAGPLPEQDATDGVAERAAAAMWADLSGAPTDPDVALIGDEFSVAVLWWLEALGRCDAGAAGRFVATGAAISRGGVLPVNPHGGHLGTGRRPDLDLVVEAVAQLRGTAGRAQVRGGPTTAVVGLGGRAAAGCLLLRR
ncbi:thiolase C-terminal domain-containing protein [Rhodococcus sp. NPDC054953]